MSVKQTASKTRQWEPDPNISQKELEKMREKVMDRVITARIGLLMRHSFFGTLATRLRIQDCDEWCPTAATDGRNLYFNTQFFNAMDNKEIEFVIAHEILHCVFDHLGRRDHRDPKLYNIAADYIVNNLLIRDGIGKKPSIVNCFHDRKYANWTSEEVYDELFKNAEKIDISKLGEMLDEHYDWGSGDDEESGEGQGKGQGKRPTLSKEEMDAIRDEFREAMIAAAQSSDAGSLPGEISRMIKELTEPKMNWRELLRQQIQSTIRSDYTFIRPNRKGWHVGAVLPGMDFEQTIDVAVALDMSGSIGDDQARDFLSEVKGIMEEFKDYRITVMCFDTKVYNEQTFTSDNGEELLEYKIMGGGGTDFDCVWNYMKREDVVPKKLLFFTDGYAGHSWGDPDYCDTIFIIHSNHDKNLEAPFGMTAHYDANA